LLQDEAKPLRAPTALPLTLLAALALWLHARRYLPLFVDDGFISLRYAQRLLQGDGLSWSAGEPVEGYTNFLWVVGCAALNAVGIELVNAARTLGSGGAVAILAALWFAEADRPHARRSITAMSLPLCVALMFIASCGPVAAWAVGGLEAALFGGLVAWALALLLPWLTEREVKSWRALLPAQLVLAALCLLRPDGALIAAVLLVAVVDQAATRKVALTNGWRLAIGPALAVACHLLFRLSYYGRWVPNTANAKLALSSTRVLEGLACLEQAAICSWPLLVLALLSLVVTRRDPVLRRRVQLLAALLLIWTAYVLFVNASCFAYRALVPSYVAAAFLAAETTTWLAARGPKWAVGALAMVPLFAWLQQRDGNLTDARSFSQPWSWRGASIGVLLRDSFTAEQPLVAVDAAGAIPYFSRLPSLDMLGLNDHHIADRRPDNFGHGLAGHELGDGAYVLDRAPDIIISGIVGNAQLNYRGGAEAMADPRFSQRYRRIRALANSGNVDGHRTEAVMFHAFIALEGAVGVTKPSAERITVPGYLFANQRGALAARRDDQLVALLDPGSRVQLSGIPLTAGRWRWRAITQSSEAPQIVVTAPAPATVAEAVITTVTDTTVSLTLVAHKPTSLVALVATAE